MIDSPSDANDTRSPAVIAEIRQRDEKIERLTTQLTQNLRESAASTAILSNRGDLFGLMPHVLPHLIAVEDPKQPGTYSVVAADPNNAKKPFKHPNGTFESANDVVARLRAHPEIGKFFGDPAARGADDSVLRLTREEAVDPKRYQALKDKIKKGELTAVYLPDGRRLL